MIHIRIPGVVASLAFASVGCASLASSSVPSQQLLARAAREKSLAIEAHHTPLYSPVAHTSTITASAIDTHAGVAEISIEVFDGELTACTEQGGVPSLMPCRSAAVAKGRVCTFLNPTSLVSCELELSLGDRRLVTYRASVRSGSGRTATTRAVTYAGGRPPRQTTVMLIDGPVQTGWETAQPILWHSDDPAEAGALANKLDVVFFPDEDFFSDEDVDAHYARFATEADKIVQGAFYGAEPFAASYGLWRGSFNLWAGPRGADGEGCERTFIGDAANVAGLADGAVILHEKEFDDCAAIALRGAGTTQTTTFEPSWVFTHESGHFLHGLSDEYQGPNGVPAAISDPPNVYPSLQACQDSAKLLSLNPALCAQIETAAAWRIDDTQPTTMEDRDSESDWRTASGIALLRRVTKCTGGVCY